MANVFLEPPYRSNPPRPPGPPPPTLPLHPFIAQLFPADVLLRGALEDLLVAAARQPGNARVHRAVAAGLCNLSVTDDGWAAVAAKGGLNWLLDTMAAFPNAPEVQVRCGRYTRTFVATQRQCGVFRWYPRAW